MEEHTGPRRRPPAGGYARGDLKRVKIIEAALKVFGEQGYEQASTRQIARDAGVNPPALQYYFNGKEGLHLACFEYIAAHLARALEPVYAAADAVEPGDPPGKMADALCDIMDTLADYLFGAAQLEGWSRFIARGVGEGWSGQSYEARKQNLAGKLHAKCDRLVGLATGCPATDALTKLRTTAILGQLTPFHLSRDNTLATLGWPDFHGERLEMLKTTLRQHTRAILDPKSAR